jgi:hypothetical protein
MLKIGISGNGSLSRTKLKVLVLKKKRRTVK